MSDPLRTESLLAALTTDPSEQVALEAQAELDRLEADRSPEDPSSVIELDDALQQQNRLTARQEGALF